MSKKYVHTSYKISEWFTWFAMIAFVATAFPQLSNAMSWSINVQIIMTISQSLPLLIIMGCSFIFRILDNRLLD